MPRLWLFGRGVASTKRTCGFPDRTQRGTFNQRTQLIRRTENENDTCRFRTLAPGQRQRRAFCEVYNSRFRSGPCVGLVWFSARLSEALVMWEKKAQFGDCGNGRACDPRPVISAAEDKWDLRQGGSALPHGTKD